MRIGLGTDKTGQEAWVELMDPDDLTADQFARVQDAITVGQRATGEVGAGGGARIRMPAAMVAEVATAWWKPERISTETVLALPMRMFRKLEHAVEPHFEAANFDPESPTSSG